MKLVNMSDLKSDAERLPGSSPGAPTINKEIEMSNEMIERVIKASFDCWNKNKGLNYTVDDLSSSEREFAELHAREIIQAMRELPDEIKKAEGIYCNCNTCGGHEEGWQKIIDKILES